MKTWLWASAIVCLVLMGGRAAAGEPAPASQSGRGPGVQPAASQQQLPEPQPPAGSGQPLQVDSFGVQGLEVLLAQDKKDPKLPPKKEPAREEEPEMFAQAPTADSAAPEGLNPHMIGDFGALYALERLRVLVPFPSGAVPFNLTARLLVTSPGSFKIAENESPRPMDRVFFTFNSFGDMHGGPLPTFEKIINPKNPSQYAILALPNIPAPRFDFYRQVFGFEKTFLDGNASFGMRVPLLQERGDYPYHADNIGDLTAIFKYAFLRNDETGNLASAGLAITLPTGRTIDTVDGNIHPVLLQPYAGYIWNVGDFYLHGFISVVVPTDSRDVTLLFNDIGIGYWLYRGDADQFLRSVVPTIEAHVTTPLNNRCEDALISFPDMLVLTGGVHFDIARRSRLTLGMAAPVTGPHPFNVEAMAQFNWIF